MLLIGGNFCVSYSNFGDSNEKQSKDGDNESADSEPRNLNESHESGDNGGNIGAVESNESSAAEAVAVAAAAAVTVTPATTTRTANEERSFPRIQIKSPSKLAQEFNEKQKQSETASNESNRTNNNKSSVDLNTTPLYDEPTERPYSLKETTPSSHSFDTQNHETLSTTNTNAVIAEITTDNCEH